MLTINGKWDKNFRIIELRSFIEFFPAKVSGQVEPDEIPDVSLAALAMSQ